MLVSEAIERLRDRAPRFGDPEDIEAATVRGLYVEAVARLTRTVKVPAHRDKRLAELLEADRATLEAYVHPRLHRAQRRAKPTARSR